MTTEETLLLKLLAEVAELKAMIAQLGPVEHKPTIHQEIAAAKAQGIDLAEYFHAKGKAAAKATRRKPVRKEKKP